MPAQAPSVEVVCLPKIRRRHTGCRPCRRRGKRCDEAKPHCTTCIRLSLDCSYGIDLLSFRNFCGIQPYQPTGSQVVSSIATGFRQKTSKYTTGIYGQTSELYAQSEGSTLKLPPNLNVRGNLEATYLNHFHSHLRQILPTNPLLFSKNEYQNPCLRFAMLCLSASNLSMLDTAVRSRVSAIDNRKSVFSPSINEKHHHHAERYHDLALWYCRNATPDEIRHQAPSILIALVLLALYHHASTNHLNFRVAVSESVQFVVHNRIHINDLPDGADALQMWFRLCTSHRPSKPPALLLEGQGASASGPNLLPDVTEHLYLSCTLGMSGDDLIYDILVKTLEIRTKLAVFQCIAHSYQLSESSSEVGILAHETLSRMLGRYCSPEEYVEARKGFIRNSHLLGLLDVQKERLSVWRSQFGAASLPTEGYTDSFNKNDSSCTSPPECQTSPTHRDIMNTLYCLLCDITFEQSSSVYKPGHTFLRPHQFRNFALESMAQSLCESATRLDFSTSSTADVYTLSLAEVLLQLVLLWRSDEIFIYVLDVLWPRLEMNGRGFEHSHYPTHLVKRIIVQISALWQQGRAVTIALPAVPEDIPKSRLLDFDNPLELVVCGYDHDQHFIEKWLL